MLDIKHWKNGKFSNVLPKHFTDFPTQTLTVGVCRRFDRLFLEHLLVANIAGSDTAHLLSLVLVFPVNQLACASLSVGVPRKGWLIWEADLSTTRSGRTS